MKKAQYLVLFSLFAMNLVDQPAPEVEIDSGVLSGRISSDGDILEYVGIPYATSERFQAPKPPPKWKGVFKATDGSSQCVQPTPWGAIIGTEDCLKINVYVPAKAEKKALPVMFYVHGGAFVSGSGGRLLQGPDFLVKRDVIVVTFNYRLGPFGFLCLHIKEVPGNAGLKDQIAALKWVQRNIAAFGGDPDNVTIFGHSAGGTSVSLLLASEATAGLFQKAIVHSGSALANWALNYNPIKLAKSMAKQLGHDTDDLLELYKFYKNAPYKDLLKPIAHISVMQQMLQNVLHYPCVEKRFPYIEPVIAEMPHNLITRNPKNISIIYGSTDKEGLLYISEETEQSIRNANNKYFVQDDLVFGSDEEAVCMSEKIKDFYFAPEYNMNYRHIANSSDTYWNLYFEIPVKLESEIMVHKIEAPIYNYYFTYSGGRNAIKIFTGHSNVTGACHGDDITYLFDPVLKIFTRSEKDYMVIRWMTKMWTNFAKFGNPTPDTDKELPIKWEPSSISKMKFMYIGDELKMGPLPNPESFKFWKDIYKKHRNLGLK